MKKAIAIISLFLSVSFLFGCDKLEKKKTYLLMEETITESSNHGDSVHITSETKIKHTYDQNGYLLSSKSEVFPETAFNTTTEYENDASGRVLHKTVRDCNNKITKDIRYTYDDAGNLLVEDSANTVKRLKTIIRTYDEKGRPLTVTTENHPVSSETKEVYTYDDEKRTESISYYEDGVFQKTQETLMDAEGRPVSITFHYEGGKSVTMYQYTYSGNTEKLSRYNFDGLVIETDVKTFDDQGRLLNEESRNVNGKVAYTTAYTYDENGNLSRKGYTRYNATSTQSTITEYKYEARNK